VILLSTRLKLLVAFIACYLGVLHVPSLLVYAYTWLFLPRVTPPVYCDVLVVAPAPINVSKILQALHGYSVCIVHPSIYNYTLLSRIHSRIAVVVAHGSGGYLATSTRVTPVDVYLSFTQFEIGEYMILETNDGDFIAVRGDVLLPLIAGKIIVVSCAQVNSPRVIAHYHSLSSALHYLSALQRHRT